MSLAGFWMNELKSVMLLDHKADGTLVGQYRSIVGRDPNPRPLAGRAGDDEQGKRMLGFAVVFKIANPASGYGHFSACTWSGWATKDNVITTHWLLSISILNAADEWSSTLIGEDRFEKVFSKADSSHLNASSDELREMFERFRKEGLQE
jgi:Avidin family